MYLPVKFAVNDLDEVAEVVADVGAADVVTAGAGFPRSTLMPVMWDRAPSAPGGYGRLLAHMARANEHWRSIDPGAPALAIVHGPQAYISPSWYATKAEHGRVVPTWNYVTVQFTGTVTIHHDAEWLRDVVERLTRRHEDGRAHPWAVGDAPAGYISGELRAIVGVEFEIDGVEGKRKLSQNRSADDVRGAVEGLRADADPVGQLVADLMATELERRD